jgi:hypothetical protein
MGYIMKENGHTRFFCSMKMRDGTAVNNTKMASLGYTVLAHPPYSPDLAPSDYALFNEMEEPL